MKDKHEPVLTGFSNTVKNFFMVINDLIWGSVAEEADSEAAKLWDPLAKLYRGILNLWSFILHVIRSLPHEVKDEYLKGANQYFKCKFEVFCEDNVPDLNFNPT